MERVRKRVPCTIEYVGLESDFVGLPVPGFLATCSRCHHQTKSIGTTRSSIRETERDFRASFEQEHGATRAGLAR